jgi:hypothetical protein
VILKALPLARKPTVHLFELPGGREIARQDWRVERRFFGYFFKFFPDGRRLLVSAGMGSEVAIVDTPSLGTLAKLEKSGPFYQCAIAGSGRNFATVDMFMKVRLYRQVGGECRESTLGVLGMPHVWLLLVLVGAGALSLRADAARRAAEPPGRGVWLIALVLLLAALPRAGQFILTLCVEGRVLWSATPLVLICAIGLASGSRTWRMITMIVLVVCVAVNVFCLVQLRRAGLGESLVLGVADRSYTIANLAVFVVLCGLTVGMMGVVVWLARLRLTSSV